MGYTLPQIAVILAKADRTMYKIGAIAYDDMFNQLDESLDYDRDIIYIYKVAVEYADNFYVGTEKLDTVVERLGAKVAVYDFGQLTPIYSDSTIVTQVVPVGAALDDLSDVTITNVQNNQTLRYSSSLGQWVNVGPGASVRNRQQFTATLNQTVFVTSFQFESGLLDVYLNGVKLSPPSYTTFGNYTITLADGSLADDIVEVIAYAPETSFIDLSGYVPTSRTLTINGVTYDLSANRSWTVTAGLSSVGLSMPSGFTVSNSPLTTNGTITVGLASGYSIPTTASQATWNTAYNDSIVSAGVTGTSTKTLTLNQQDGGTVTASWSDIDTGLTSVGLSMPSAFAVSNSPLTSNGTIAVTGAGTSAQYVRGDGQLANFPTNGGGGSSVNYYLNGSVSQGTFGGDTYYEMSKTPIIGAGTNFTRTNAQGNGYIASFITDAGDPALLNIPGGNWNVEFYFQASSSGSTPSFYAELYKVSSSNVFTLIGSGSTNPEGITNGTAVDQYYTSIPVPQTALLATDRLAVRIFVTPSGRTITLHTEDNNLCEVLTTFSTGLNALNGLTAQVQYFATGTSGTDFAISSATDTHTFNLPIASGTNTGKLSNTDWTTFNNKVGGSGATGQVAYWNGTSSQTGSANLIFDGTRLGIGRTPAARKLEILQALGGNAAMIGLYASGGSFVAAIGTQPTTDSLQFASTAGVLFYTGSTIGGIATEPTNERMRLTTAGRLLLGTTTESTYLLDVNGTARVSGNLTVTGVIYTDAVATRSGASIDFRDQAAASIMYLDATNKRVGIGTASPSYKLHVVGTSVLFQNAGTFELDLLNTTSGNYLRATAGATDSNIGTIQNIPFSFIINGTRVGQFTSTNGNLILQNGGTFTDAGYRLDVNGTARVSGAATFGSSVIASGLISSATEYRFLNATFSRLGIVDGGGAFAGGYNFNINGGTPQHDSTGSLSAYYYKSSGDISFYTNSSQASGTAASERVRITSGGNLLVGTTTNVASSKVTIDSTTQGFLPPRMTNAQRTAISSPAVGLMVYQTDSTEGTYEYISSGWRIINGGGGGSVDELQVALLSQVYG